MGWLCSLHGYFFETYYAIKKGRLAWCGVAKYSISGLGTELGLMETEKYILRLEVQEGANEAFFEKRKEVLGVARGWHRLSMIFSFGSCC